MRKILELLKTYLLQQLRNPFQLIWTAGIVLGILFFGFVLNPDKSAEIISAYSVFLLAYSSAVMLGMVISQERETGLFRMIRTTRISKIEYLVSKFTISNISGIIFALTVLLIGVMNSGIKFRPLAWAIVFIVTAFAHTGIGIIIAAYFKKDKHVQFAGSIVMMGMFILSPIFYSLESLPELFRIFPWAVPLTYATESMKMIAVKGSSIYLIAPYLSVLTIFGIVTTVIGYRKLEF